MQQYPGLSVSGKGEQRFPEVNYPEGSSVSLILPVFYCSHGSKYTNKNHGKWYTSAER
jgi:hypothetical protein